MWDRLCKQVQVERDQLRHLLDTHRSLLIKCERVTADPIELSALAAVLHSFYTGIENIFKRIALTLDGGLPEGEIWHRRLLDSMATASSVRSAVISQSLRDNLRGYLDFRHVFRHAYTFELRWQKMSGLVINCASVFRQLETEFDAFLESLRSGTSEPGSGKGDGRKSS